MLYKLARMASGNSTSLKWMLNLYPPFVGAGIRIREIAPDFRFCRVELPLTVFNTNYVGVHFGGSLYSMTDPFYMLLLLNILGKDYIVWDKAASIEYVRPGTSKVVAQFEITDEMLKPIYQLTPNDKPLVFDWPVNVVDANTGDLVAKVTKTEYVRKKPDSSAKDEVEGTIWSKL